MISNEAIIAISTAISAVITTIGSVIVGIMGKKETKKVKAIATDAQIHATRNSEAHAELREVVNELASVPSSNAILNEGRRGGTRK